MSSDLTGLVNLATLVTLVVGIIVYVRKTGATAQSLQDAQGNFKESLRRLTDQNAELTRNVGQLLLITTRGEMTDADHNRHLADLESRLRKIERQNRRDPMTDTP